MRLWASEINKNILNKLILNKQNKSEELLLSK